MKNEQNASEHSTQLDPNNGSQLIIENNTGTINVYNQNDTKLFEQLIELNKNQQKNDEYIYKMIENTIEYAKKLVENEMKQSKRKTRP